MFDPKANHAYYLSRGLCPRCGGKHPVRPGMKRCMECSVKESERLRTWRAARIKAGACTRCGGELAADGCITCPDCRHKQRKTIDGNALSRRV